MRELKGEKERGPGGWDGYETGEERMSQKQQRVVSAGGWGRVLLFHFTFITETVEY